MYVIKVKKGEVLHDNFRKQIREAARMLITSEMVKSQMTGNKPDINPLLDTTLEMIAIEVRTMFIDIIAECDKDGAEKLLDELKEKIG